MKRILTGSKVKNPTDLLVGSSTDHLIDRSMQIVSSAPVTWASGQLVSSQPIKLEFLLEAGGAYAVNQIAAGTITLADGEVVVAYISRSAGTTTLSSGTYSTLTSGQYAIVAASSLNAADSSNKDHVILFRREDAGGVKQLLIPLHKQLYVDNTTINLSGYPFPSIYTADVHDVLATTQATGVPVTVDGVSVTDGMLVLFSNLLSGNNEIYKATVSAGNVTAWTAQNSFSGLATPALSDLIKIKQGVAYAGQIGLFNGSNWLFNDTVKHFNTAGDYWEETSIRRSTLSSNTTGNVFTTPYLGTNNATIRYSVSRGLNKETGIIYVTHNNTTASAAISNTQVGDCGITFSADISGSDLRLRYTSDNSIVGTFEIKYIVTRWSDITGGPTGIPNYTSFLPPASLFSAFCMSDGAGVEVNCSAPTVVLGKTQVVLSQPYVMGVGAGTTTGDLTVVVDGLVFPRYLAGVITSGGYYKEINPTTIEFYTDLSAVSLSIEIYRKAAVVDIQQTALNRFASLYDTVVGSSAQVLQGVAQYTSIQSAINAVPAGSNILVLANTYNENININKQLTIDGKGFGTFINGNVTFTSASTGSLLSKAKINGNIVFSVGSASNQLVYSWQLTSATVTDSGTSNLYSLGDF